LADSLQGCRAKRGQAGSLSSESARMANFLNFDGVALHLVIKGRALNTEQLGRFLLVSVRLGKRLENRLSLHVVETGHSAAACRAGSRLQCWRQLDFRRQFLDPDYVIPCQDDGVLYGVLQF